MEPIVLCFSGGKDSLLALRELQQQEEFEVVGLLTTMSEEYKRISMHGVRRSLLRVQARSLDLPLMEVSVPAMSSNEIYEREMGRAFRRLAAEGIRHIAFGDIFLQDLRDYRQRQLAACGLRCVFPLWQRNTAELAARFVVEGFRAVVVCVHPEQLERSFAGREFNRSFLVELPGSVDPCGENGEFHTFVYDGPNFRYPLSVQRGEIVERNGFVYCDVELHSGNEPDPAFCALNLPGEKL